jgi:hypothetical protein
MDMVGMNRRTMCFALGAAAMARAMARPKPWESKPIADWSQRDVEAILTDSPWARSVTALTLPSLLVSGFPDRLEKPNAQGREQADDHRTLQYLIRWDSAKPIREALARTQKRGPIYAAVPAEEAERHYILSVIILRPEPVSSGDFEVNENQRNRITTLSMLRRLDHADLHPCKIVGKRGNVLYKLSFAKADPIMPESGSIEFVTRAVPAPLSCVFPLSEMFFHGKFAV